MSNYEQTFKMFAWVPDGVYDSTQCLVRYVINNGNPATVITKSWIDSGGPAGVDQQLIAPWGYFADIPPKP